MKNHSDSDWENLRHRILGLGDTSIRKSHYASLRQRLVELESAELRIRKLNRLYRVVTQVNKAICKTATRDKLFWEVCRLFVDCGGFRLAWIAMDTAEDACPPVAWAGDDPFFAHSCNSMVAGLRAAAVLTGRSQYCNDLNVADIPCQAQALRRGYRSACAVLLSLPVNRTGALVLYSGEASFFDEEEVRLLEGVASDISFACGSILREEQRQRAEQVTRETHRHIQTLFEASPVAMVAVDSEGMVTEWNQAAEELFGWSRQEVLGCPNPIAANSAGDVETRGPRWNHSAHSALETRRKRKDGTWVDVSVSAAPLHDDSGETRGFIVIYVDVSERKRLEAQLMQAQKMETIGRLAGGIAHDFNNLLTVVNGHADLLLQQPLRQEVLSHVGEIRSAGQQAAELTRQLLAFSRKQTLQPQVVPLDKIVADMESILVRLMPEDILLTASLESGAACVYADPGQVRQVILNLVVNARDAIVGGGKIAVRTETVYVEDAFDEVTGLQSGEYVALTVTDNGMGIDKELQSRIFEPFFTTKERGKGTGLGLATVWGIVKQSGGHVRVCSESNSGSMFAVYLPRVYYKAEAGEKTEPGAVAPGTETVLLVEDRDDVRFLTAEILKTYGYRVLLAATGDEALSVCRASEPVDLVITDVMMPEMTGPELAARIHESFPQTQVLYVSGYASEMFLDDATLEQSAGFLQKPYSAIELGTTVRRILNDSQRNVKKRVV